MIISSGALGGATASIFFIKDDTKKFNIYFLIISIMYPKQARSIIA